MVSQVWVLAGELKKWCIIFRNNKPLSPFMAHFTMLRTNGIYLVSTLRTTLHTKVATWNPFWVRSMCFLKWSFLKMIPTLPAPDLFDRVSPQVKFVSCLAANLLVFLVFCPHRFASCSLVQTCVPTFPNLSAGFFARTRFLTFLHRSFLSRQTKKRLS